MMAGKSAFIMKAHFFLITAVALSGVLHFSTASGQGKGRPPGGPGGFGGREHTATEAQELDLVRANRKPPEKTEVEIRENGDLREITSNGMPDHLVGRFPNRDNPNEIREQAHDVGIPLIPDEADEITYLHGPLADRRFRVFGITLDGVLMEPGTAERWKGRPDCSYEALGGAVPLGLDENYAHVQPDGNYHYHGLPIGLMKRLGFKNGEHSPIIGWAADGFPIYALFGYSDPMEAGSAIEEMKTGYELKEGERPGGRDAPDGEYDGAFVEDYEYIGGDGTLDECNGRFCVTPEFPGGTYAYFLTREWPVIPRAFRGTPEQLKTFREEGGPRDFGGFGGEERRGPRPGERPPRRR